MDNIDIISNYIAESSSRVVNIELISEIDEYSFYTADYITPDGTYITTKFTIECANGESRIIRITNRDKSLAIAHVTLTYDVKTESLVFYGRRKNHLFVLDVDTNLMYIIEKTMNGDFEFSKTEAISVKRMIRYRIEEWLNENYPGSTSVYVKIDNTNPNISLGYHADVYITSNNPTHNTVVYSIFATPSDLTATYIETNFN